MMTKHRNKTDYGMADFFSYYNKNNNYKLNRKTFSHIISEMNLTVVDSLLNETREFKLPARCGAIIIRKTKRKVKLVDGKVINTNPPDWQKTKKLWEKDEECKAKKIIIRHTNVHTNGYVFHILYSKATAFFKNKSFFEFKAARAFRRDLKDRINDYVKNKFDSPKLY